MEKLRALGEDLGLTGVMTYIQSGNIVFQHAKVPSYLLEKKMQAAIQDCVLITKPHKILLKEQN
jgi:uncharacterized protein (DUF1697 family)